MLDFSTRSPEETLIIVFTGVAFRRNMTPFAHTSLMRLTIAALAMVAALGCAPVKESKQRIDLIDAFPQARVMTETEIVDFSDPSVQEILGSGWLIPLERPGIRAKAWGIGRQSEMMIFRLRPENLTLAFRCVPFQFEDGRRQGVSFLVNGHLVDEVDLEPGMQKVVVEVPAEVLRSGENSITMQYAESQSRGMAFSKRSDDRAVAWALLTIRPSTVIGEGSPEAHADNRELFIPFGSRVDYFLGPVRHGEFSVEKVEISGTGRGRLVVSSQVGEARESVVGSAGLGKDSMTAAITGSEAEPVRLSLAAIGQRSNKCEGPCGIVLTGPVVASLEREAHGKKVASVAGARSPSLSDRPNVVVYLIDALRADHLGCYGYDRPVSPHIDQFAAQAVLFERAQAQTSWTRASVASVFSGLMPQVHSANDDDDALSDSVTTIAEYLRAAGYQTAGFTANGNAGPNVGFAQGFQVFRHLGAARSEVLGDEFSPWLDDLNPDDPFFLWVHAVDPHAPYMPPDDLRKKFAPDVTDRNLGSVARVSNLNRRPDRLSAELIADLVSLYDGEVAANDRSFGALIADLRDRELLEDTLIILVSDHGEEFYDHGGWTHGKTLYAEQLDIPLIVKYPGSDNGERISEIVQHVDILPTILDVVGLETPADIQGRNLRVLLSEEGRRQWENRSYSSLDLRGRQGTSVTDGRWKVISLHDRGRGSLPKLFDKRDDSPEKDDLASTSPDRVASLMALDRKLKSQLPQSIKAPMVDTSDKEEMHEALRALGYVE